MVFEAERRTQGLGKAGQIWSRKARVLVNCVGADDSLAISYSSNITLVEQKTQDHGTHSCQMTSTV